MKALATGPETRAHSGQLCGMELTLSIKSLKAEGSG